MRTSRHVASGIAVVVMCSMLSGCAPFGRPKRETAAPQAPVPAPTPPPPPVTDAPPPPPTPVDVIGPRTATPPAPVVEAPPLAPPPTTPPIPPAQRGKFVVLNFDNADVETVIHAASEIVGFNYVLAPDVRGKVTVQTSGRIPQEDVFGVLLAILELHGFTAIKAGSLYKIVRIEGARERAIPTIIGATPDPQRLATDEVITQIVPLRFSSVVDLGNLLRPLISTRGALITHRETNILIVTDTASNVRRLLDIVRLVDVEVALEELTIIPVRFADAGDLEGILTRLFQTGRLRGGGTPTVPGAPAPAPVPTPAPVPGAPPAVRPPTPPETGGVTDRIPLIAAVRRSNSLIVHGRKHEIELVRRLVSQLDVNIYGGRRVFIYYAENAKAKDLSSTLNAIYTGKETVPASTPSAPTAPRRAGEPAPIPGPSPTSAPGAPLTPGTGTLEGEVRFIADETTNAVIVTTFPHNWPEIEATIRQLDKSPRQVLIEVLVAEITLSDDTRLGIDFALRGGHLRVVNTTLNPVTPGITTPTVSVGQLGALATGLPGAGLTAFTTNISDFFAMLNALATDSRVNVLSNPHVMTSENKKAVINVSDSIPIITSQQTGTLAPVTPGGTPTTTGSLNQTVEYKDAGVILTVTPRIGERGTVALDVKQEVNDIGAAEPPTGSRRIIKREAETSVVLANNQTLVLGGLIRERNLVEDRGIPLLKDIPVLGYLFGTKVRTVNKTELLLLITPRVVGSAADAFKITDQMRRATPEIDRATRSAPRPPGVTPPPPVDPTQPPGAPGVTVVPGAPAPAPPPAVPAPPAPPGTVPAPPPTPPTPR